MAYLTLDADVKDDFVQDIPALQAMFEMAKASRALTSASGELYWLQAHQAFCWAGNGPLRPQPGCPLHSLCNLDQSFAPFSPSFFLTIKRAHSSLHAFQAVGGWTRGWYVLTGVLRQ